MKIYLAGSCGIERRSHMKEIAAALRENGHTVFCPFELKIDNAWDMPQEEWAAKVFACDIKAIDSAECVILLSPGRISTAGTNWEQGYAYAKGKPVYVFQYTSEPASLMSYCGCSNFFLVDNTTPMHTALQISTITSQLFASECEKIPTSVVLT